MLPNDPISYKIKPVKITRWKHLLFQFLFAPSPYRSLPCFTRISFCTNHMPHRKRTVRQNRGRNPILRYFGYLRNPIIIIKKMNENNNRSKVLFFILSYLFFFFVSIKAENSVLTISPSFPRSRSDWQQALSTKGDS